MVGALKPCLPMAVWGLGPDKIQKVGGAVGPKKVGKGQLPQV